MAGDTVRPRAAVGSASFGGSRRVGRTAAAFLAVGAAGFAITGAVSAQEQGAADNELGKQTYDRWCAGCHGVDGAGEGPGAGMMLPRPRDFTRAQYQIRTTASGELPTDEDILHVIDVGMPGTSMPGWEDVLSRAEREALVDYLKSFSRFFRPDAQPEPLEFGSAPSANDERLARGEELYQQIECWKCHGDQGRGYGTSAFTLEDDAGHPIYAADLTENWNFNGGGSVEDIYRRLRTGMDGTPMPTFWDMVEADIITEDDLWSLALYVRSLSPEDRPVVREVVVAERLDEGAALPTAADSELWQEADRFYVPLAGQIIEQPRWFSPRVDGIWVQALHDGETLAMLVSWSDPSESPDPRWAEFATRIEEVVEPDEDAGWAPGAPDRLVVQFPQRPSEGMERPYFLQGDDRRPAYLWTWESDREGAREQIARGLGTAQDQPRDAQQVEASATWSEGQWQVLFRRSLTTPDSADDLQFVTGRVIPVAFQAWDGDNAEAGGRAAVSSWYFVHLGEPTPLTAYVSPVVALVLTALLGMLLIRQARRKERESGGSVAAAEPVGAAAGD